jgi:hypothetical protein
MSSGTFRSIFNYCTSDAAGIEEVYFKELFEGQLRVYFDGPGNFLFQPLVGHGPGGSVTLGRAGVEVKQLISYRFAQVTSLGSPAVADCMQRRRREYRPPSRGVV